MEFKKTFKYECCKTCECTCGKDKECNICIDGNFYAQLWQADENCVHEMIDGNGTRCSKCGGWCCF